MPSPGLCPTSRRWPASTAAATGGLDALVFTGGVGEHSPTMRRRAAERLGFLGVTIDPHHNDAAAQDISATAPPCTPW
jgi:acetate kinase